MSDHPRDGLPAAAPRAGDAEGRFRTIFEHSNDAIFLLDPEADAILDVNLRACRMLGYSRAELLALRISDVHPAEMHEFVAFARTVLDTGSGWTNELGCLTRSGATLPAEISASVIEMDGRACVIAMVRDISERKQAEAELQRYRENLERLVEERAAELRQSEQRQRALVAVGNAIVANLDREALFEAIARAFREVLAVDRVYVLGAAGTILFRAHWANDTKALATALDAIVAGESPRHSQSGGVVKPMLRMLRNIAPVLDRAGTGAWADVWRVAPHSQPSPSRSRLYASLRAGPDAPVGRSPRELAPLQMRLSGASIAARTLSKSAPGEAPPSAPGGKPTTLEARMKKLGITRKA